MKRATIFCAVFLATVAMVASAGTSNIALAPDGTLYRLEPVNGELTITVQHPDQEDGSIVVPQAAAANASSLLLDIDPATGTLAAVWQVTPSPNLSWIMLATWHDGTWFGPIAVAGQGGSPAVHPSLLIHDTKLTTTDEDGNVTVTGIESRIHLAWWQDPNAEDGGRAYYASTVLDEHGVPDMEDWDPISMRSLAPWGYTCNLGKDASGLTYPRLFVDAQSGDPHLIFTDLPNCMFGIVRLAEEPAGTGDDEEPLTSQRRRNVIVLGLRKMVFIKPGLPLNDADFEVGHNLSIALYWNTGDAVQYITLDNDSWSDIKTLKLDERLSREDAINLVRRLAR